MKKTETIEKAVDMIVDYIMDIITEATEDRQKDIYEHADCHINDIVREKNQSYNRWNDLDIVFSEKELLEIMQKSEEKIKEIYSEDFA